jgi:hypothetical protein
MPDIDLFAWAEPNLLHKHVYQPVPINPVPFWSDFGHSHFRQAYKYMGGPY